MGALAHRFQVRATAAPSVNALSGSGITFAMWNVPMVLQGHIAKSEPLVVKECRA